MLQSKPRRYYLGPSCLFFLNVIPILSWISQRLIVLLMSLKNGSMQEFVMVGLYRKI